MSRRAGESVVIGHDVVVTVLEVRGDVVRVGIAAPRSVQVHREEVYRELREENRTAAAATSDAAVAAIAARLAAKTPAAADAPAVEAGGAPPA
nr:carbon storage regulator CsrA [Motilibacter deserti]